MSEARPSHRIGDIECLRGIAVLMVILYHIHDSLLTWKISGWDHVDTYYFQTWPGVDLFFAISGFVIARTLLPAIAGSPAPARVMGAFWIRRFWRLIPSAWTWLAVILLASLLFNRTGVFETFHTNFESATAAMLSVANFREGAIFMRLPYGPSSPYWSLSLEEQFYAVLPPLAYLCGRRLVPVLGIATILVFLLPYQTWVMMIRVHAVLLGVLLAAASRQPGYAAFAPDFLRGRPWAGLLILLGVVLLMSSLAPIQQHILANPLGMIALLGALLVFIASHNQNYLFGYAVCRIPLTWVGTRSYALYLAHVPIFCATRELWGRWPPPAGHHAWPLLLTALPLLAIAAETNYRLLEVPLRRKGARIAARFAEA